jgi:hypothetical protein
MVVAIVALVVATTGGAVAAGRLLTGANIANGSLTGADVKDRSLGAADLTPAAVKSLKGQQGPAGPIGPQGPAGPAGALGIPLWAVVNANATLARGTAGVTAAKLAAPPSTGFYAVSFPRNVADCAYSVTIAGSGNGYPGTGQISAYSTLGNANSVTVATHTSAGGLADLPFHLLVAC